MMYFQVKMRESGRKNVVREKETTSKSTAHVGRI